MGRYAPTSRVRQLTHAEHKCTHQVWNGSEMVCADEDHNLRHVYAGDRECGSCKTYLYVVIFDSLHTHGRCARGSDMHAHAHARHTYDNRKVGMQETHHVHAQTRPHLGGYPGMH